MSRATNDSKQSQLPGRAVRSANRVTVEPDARLIAAIRARAGPGRARAVRVIRTAGAWVMCAGGQVWKCRRPIKTRFADLTEPAARGAACLAELELNRRFAPELYLGVEALVCSSDGELHWVEAEPKTLGTAEPNVIEWLIRMKRLPAEGFFDRALMAGRVGCTELARVARYLEQFYLVLPASSLSSERYVERFRREIELSCAVLEPIAPKMAAALVARLDALSPLLESRQRDGGLVDGHGDLRPAHLCLAAEVSLIDALDCDPMLRQVDPWEELCLLGLMAGELGAAWLGPVLARQVRVDRRHRPGRDMVLRNRLRRPRPELLAFYTAYHALTRARLAYAHLEHNPGGRRRHWLELSQRLARMAEAGLAGWNALGDAT